MGWSLRLIVSGKTERVRALISLGAYPRFQDKDGITPIRIAELKGFLQIVSLLMSNPVQNSLYEVNKK